MSWDCRWGLQPGSYNNLMLKYYSTYCDPISLCIGRLKVNRMRKRTKISLVLKHMFSRKALLYRAFTVTWTMCAVLFWNYVYFKKLIFFESLEVTMTIVFGKFLFYGIWEYFHLREVDMDAVYDEEGHERVSEILAIRGEDGRYHDPDVEDDFPPGTV